MKKKKDMFMAFDAYDKLAESYAEIVDTKPHNAYLERPTTISLIPEVRGKRVLDAGCGSGSLTDWLLEQGATVTAIDASPAMLREAEKRVGGRAELKLHDFRFSLDFLEDTSVDLVVSSLALDYIMDLQPTFKEYRRVLKPSGCFIFSMGHPTIDILISDGVDEYFKKHKFEIWWSGFKERVLMPTVHRPLQDITEALYESEFLIERLLETQPTLDYKKADPEGYEKVRKRPSFICVKALPRQ